jgi:hypothetical protein
LTFTAGVESQFRRDKATRWLEYLFHLGVMTGGAVFGIMIDQVPADPGTEQVINNFRCIFDEFGITSASPTWLRLEHPQIYPP